MLKEFVRTTRRGRESTKVPFITIGEGYIHFNKAFYNTYVNGKTHACLFYDQTSADLGLKFVDKDANNAFKICVYTDPKTGYTLYRVGAGKFIIENDIEKAARAKITVNGDMVVVSK